MAASDSGDVDLRVRVARARQAKQDMDSVGKSVRGLGKDVDYVGKKAKTSRKSMALFTGATNKAKSAVMGLGRAAGSAAVFGIGALGYEIFRATKGWAAHLGVVRRTNAVIKSTQGVARVSAKHVGKLSDALERQTGMDGDLIQSGANLLLTFTNVRNGVGKNNKIFDKATATTVNMSKALGQSTKASAVQLGKALNDPIKGVTALSKVGVSFTKEQKDQIKTLVDSGKTMEAQKIILKELGKEFPKVKATPWERLLVTFRQIEDTIGSLVLPVFNKFIRKVQPPLQHLANDASNIFSDKNLNWSQKLQQLGEAIKFHMGPMAEGMLQGLKDAKLDDKLKSAIIWAEPKILEGFKSVGSKAPGTLWEAFKAAPLWAKVGGGVWIARKLGLTGKAFEALKTLTGGGKAGGALGKLLGDRGSLTNPMYVVVVDKGSGGILNKLKGLAQKAGVPAAFAARYASTLAGGVATGALSATAAASFIAYMFVKHGGHNNITKGPGSKAAGSGGVPFRPGAPRRAGTEGYADPYRGYSPAKPNPLGVGHMASGGVVRRGGPFEVGERGRERMWLPTGTTVEPHGAETPIFITTNLVVNDQVLATAVHKAATRKKSVR